MILFRSIEDINAISFYYYNLYSSNLFELRFQKFKYL